MPRDTAQIENPRLDNRDTTQTFSSFTPYELLKVQHREAPVKGMTLCSKHPILNNNIPIEIVSRKGANSRFKGLQTCNRWLCPVCSQKRIVEHSNKVSEAFNKSLANGYKTFFATFTIPRGNNAAAQINNLSGTWNLFMTSLRKWVKTELDGEYDKDKSVWFVKGLDFTFQENHKVGIFHSHYHSLLSFSPSVVESIGLEVINNKLVKLWKKSALKRGIMVTETAQKILLAEGDTGLTSYITKVCKEQNITYEIVSKRKTGKRTMGWFEIMAKIASSPTDFLRSIYREFITATKGSRLVSYSQNIRKILDMDFNDTNGENEEDIQDSESVEEIEEKRWKLSQAVHKIISGFSIEDLVLKTTDLVWEKPDSLELWALEELINKGNTIESVSSTAKQIELLSAEFVIYLQALVLNKRIGYQRAETIYKKIGSDTKQRTTVI
jgi:hypothetical protein